MYQTIINDIKTVLDGVDAIKAVYPYPLAGSSKKTPFVVFFPDAIENAFETTGDNAKSYQFRMWINVNLSGINEEQAFTSILPNAVDQVMQAFDSAWSGVSIDGHRVRKVISSGFWGLSEENKSKVAFAELVITVRLLSVI